jgi:hypothetical protein
MIYPDGRLTGTQVDIPGLTNAQAAEIAKQGVGGLPCTAFSPNGAPAPSTISNPPANGPSVG